MLYVGCTTNTAVTALLALQPEVFTTWLLTPSAMFLSQIDVTREACLELSSQIITANMAKQKEIR
jgi:hypothetical protein